MFLGRIAQAARQRLQRKPISARRLAPGLLVGGLVLVVLVVLLGWPWRDSQEVVAHAETSPDSQHSVASPFTGATKTPRSETISETTEVVTPTVTAIATATPTATTVITPGQPLSTTTLPGTALQSPLPTPDILALLSASLGVPISVSVPLPSDGLQPHVLPEPTITPTAAVTGGIAATTALTAATPISPSLAISDVLLQPIAGAPPGGMAAIVAAAQTQRTDEPTSTDELTDDDTAPAETQAEPVAPPVNEQPAPVATPAIAPTPDSTVRTARVPILMYHYLSVPPADANAYRLDLSVTPDRFAAHLDAMQQAGYTTISLYTWLAHLNQGAPLPEKPVVITFDDGYRDNYENAFPLLRERGMTATFFVVTDFIDEERPEYLTWDMVREMYAGGMSIESHGRNHVSLANKDNDYLVWQALGSLETIQYELGVRPHFVSYPAGDFDQATIDIFRSAGYWAGFTTVQGATNSSDDLFRAKRVRVHGTTTAEELLRVLALDW